MPGMRPPSRRTFTGSTLAGLLGLAIAPASAGGQTTTSPGAALSRSWKRLTTPYFTVISEGSDDAARGVAAQVTAFRTAVKTVFSAARLDPLVPTTFVVFDSDASFADFKPLDNGRRQTWVGGYAMLSDDTHYLVMARHGDPAATALIVFHEYMHYVLSRTFASVPLWYGEGVADIFGAFAGHARDSRPMIGRPIAFRLETVRSAGLLPVRDMLVTHKAERWQKEMTSRFYGTAWVMAHYFLFDAARQQGLLALFRALESGADVDAAVQQSLGHSVGDLDRQLQNYIRRSALPALAVPEATIAVDAGAEVARLTETEVARVHGDVLVRVGDLDGASALLARASRRDPADDALRTITARLRLAEQKPGDALAVLATAATPRTVDSLRAEADALGRLKRHDEASARLAEAAAIGTPGPALLFALGRAHMARRAWPEATATFARLRAADPRATWDLSRAYEAFTEGLGVYVAGAARAFISKAGWLDPRSPYAAFAGVMGLVREGRADEATALGTEVLAHTPADAWPAHIAAHLLHRVTPAALLDQASDDRERTEAHAYIGLLASLDKQPETAREHLTWVTTKGEKSLVEYRWAVAELERLGAATQP